MSEEKPEKPLFCQHAEIVVTGNGKVTFGYGCVIHPKAKIIAEDNCSVIFGEYNIIEENVVIIARPRFNPTSGADETVDVYIGNYNHFKIGAYLENCEVGNYNVFDYGCKLEGTTVQSKSYVTAGVHLSRGTEIRPGIIALDHKTVPNSNFNENDYINGIKELQKVLGKLLPKNNKIHNV